MQYCCHPNYCDRGPYYDWMLVLYEDGKTYPYKLIACFPGSFYEFDRHHLIVQQVDKNCYTGSVLFQDYLYSSDLIKIDADTVNGQFFVVETDPGKDIVTLANDKER